MIYFENISLHSDATLDRCGVCEMYTAVNLPTIMVSIKRFSWYDVTSERRIAFKNQEKTLFKVYYSLSYDQIASW